MFSLLNVNQFNAILLFFTCLVRVAARGAVGARGVGQESPRGGVVGELDVVVLLTWQRLDLVVAFMK